MQVPSSMGVNVKTKTVGSKRKSVGAAGIEYMLLLMMVALFSTRDQAAMAATATATAAMAMAVTATATTMAAVAKASKQRCMRYAVLTG